MTGTHLDGRRRLPYKSAQLRIVRLSTGKHLPEDTVAPSLYDIEYVGGAASNAHGMWTSLKHLLLGFAWLVASVPVLIISWFYGIVAVQNSTYARLAFGPFYGIERVVASKRWLRDGENFGCSYAVVKLTSVRSDELVVENNFPALFREQLEYLRFRDIDWGATPRNLHFERACYFEGMSNADKQTILDGLNEPGGWAGEHKYGTRLFFLPKQNFIGIMHFGDRSAYSRLVVRTLLAVISVSDALKCATGNYRRCREWLGH